MIKQFSNKFKELIEKEKEEVEKKILEEKYKKDYLNAIDDIDLGG